METIKIRGTEVQIGDIVQFQTKRMLQPMNASFIGCEGSEIILLGHKNRRSENSKFKLAKDDLILFLKIEEAESAISDRSQKRLRKNQLVKLVLEDGVKVHGRVIGMFAPMIAIRTIDRQIVVSSEFEVPEKMRKEKGGSLGRPL